MLKWLKCFLNGHDYTAMEFVGRSLRIGHTQNCKNCGCKWSKGVDLNGIPTYSDLIPDPPFQISFEEEQAQIKAEMDSVLNKPAKR